MGFSFFFFFFVHGIFQARILERVAISFSTRSSRPGDQTRVSRIVGRRFTIWATREVTNWWRKPFFNFLIYKMEMKITVVLLASQVLYKTGMKRYWVNALEIVNLCKYSLLLWLLNCLLTDTFICFRTHRAWGSWCCHCFEDQAGNPECDC